MKEIGLDDSGLYPSGFDEVATALHNDWADITRQLGDSGWQGWSIRCVNRFPRNASYPVAKKKVAPSC